jgi:hypothetical protein
LHVSGCRGGSIQKALLIAEPLTDEIISPAVMGAADMGCNPGAAGHDLRLRIGFSNSKIGRNRRYQFVPIK